MPSPVLNERILRSAPATWAPPEPSTMVPPMNDGPVSTWRPRAMTINGVFTASATLFVLLVAAAAVGWTMSDSETVLVNGRRFEQSTIPMLAWAG